MTETYPVLVRNRLRNKRIAVVFVGSDPGVVKSVDRCSSTPAPSRSGSGL